jgi:hypothetical protein
MLGSTALGIAIGSNCLGRSPYRTPERPIAEAPLPQRPEEPPFVETPSADETSVRSSAGGVPVGTTTITAAETESASATAALDAGTRELSPAPVAAGRNGNGAPAAAAEATPPAGVEDAAPPAPPPPAPTAAAESADAGPLRFYWRYRSEGITGGAGPFLMEPPPLNASSWTPNPEAGAGTFTTEWPPYP